MIRNRGYTLLEVLLSLTIISVLGLVFITTTQKIHERNQVRTVVSQMNAITNAAINYYKMYTEWPTTVTVLSSPLNKDLSCSVWKNASGCTRYQITSQANSHYFALAVTPPNTAIATHLVVQLPSAYQSGTTVTTYVTTFSGFKVQKQIPPPGILLAANSYQLNGVCNPATNPFQNCISSSAAQPKPYGLIDINAQPKNISVAQNVFTNQRGLGSVGASIGSTTPTCPAGTARTMMVLSAGVRMPSAEGNAANDFRYVSTAFNSYYVNFSSYASSDKMSNVSAGVGDIVCLPKNAIKNWGSG